MEKGSLGRSVTVTLLVLMVGAAGGPRASGPARAMGAGDASRPGRGPAAAEGAAGADAFLQEADGDSLLRAAREALRGHRYRRAAELYGRVASREAGDEGAARAADALYWKAFALYRVGERDALVEARRALRLYRQRYPELAAEGDAPSLLVRVQGRLAQLGDPAAAREIVEAREEIEEERAGALETRREVQEAARRRQETERRIQETERTIQRTEGRIQASEQRAEGVYGVAQEAPGDSCPDAELRAEALQALHKYDPERAFASVQRVLGEEGACSLPVRRVAVYLLSRYPLERTREQLLRVLRTDPDRQVREAALHAVSRREGPEVVALLRQILEDPSSSALHQQAVMALGRQESDEADRLLRSLAAREGASREVREAAIHTLAAREDDGSLAYLRDLFSRLEDVELKEQVLNALTRWRRVDAGWLVELAQDEGQPLRIREGAIHLAGRSEASTDALLSLYDRLGHKELKEQLIAVYAQRDEPEATDRLVEIARREDDAELRRQAVFWLARSGDERAADVLEEIVTSGSGAAQR